MQARILPGESRCAEGAATGSEPEGQKIGGLAPLLAVLTCLVSLTGFPRSTTAGPGEGTPAAKPGRSALSHGSGASGPRQVTAAQILAFAEKNAPAMRVARSRIGLGKAEAEAASPLAPEDPELEVSVGPRIGAAGSAVDVEVAVRQRLEISGARGLRIEAAERTRDRLQADLERVRWEVHHKVHAAFHAALVARERAQAAALRGAFARRLLEITLKRYQAGAISELQVQVVKGEAAQARQAEVKADSAYLAARLTLAELAGWPAPRPPAPAGKLDAPRKAPPAHKLLQVAMAQSPALKRLTAEVEEAAARVRLADRSAFPTPTIGAAYSRESEISGSANHVVLGTLALPIPLWQRNRGERARARAAAAVARARLRSAEQRLSSRVARAVIAVNSGAERVAVYGQQVVPTFERNLNMIGRAFEEGKVDALQVMVARGRFLEIQREALHAHGDYYNAHAGLEAVVGTEIWSTAAEGSRSDQETSQ